MAKLNGDTLRTARIAKRISQAQLAALLHLEYQQIISDLETGRISKPELLKDALDVVKRTPAQPRQPRTRRAA